MAITAQSIIERVVRDLNDITSVRWTIPELCRYFNDGQRDIITHRPDAKNTSAALALAAGTKQTLPAGGEKLIAVNNNTGGSKGAVTLVPRHILDAQVRNWRSLTGVTEILHYMYDPREPKTFEVYPPAAAEGASLDIEYAALPTDITPPAEGTTFTSVTGNLSLGDLFGNALQNYILYRCYRKDTEYTANAARATAFYTAYANDLGVELKGTVAVGPTPNPMATSAA